MRHQAARPYHLCPSPSLRRKREEAHARAPCRHTQGRSCFNIARQRFLVSRQRHISSRHSAHIAAQHSTGSAVRSLSTRYPRLGKGMRVAPSRWKVAIYPVTRARTARRLWHARAYGTSSVAVGHKLWGKSFEALPSLVPRLGPCLLHRGASLGIDWIFLFGCPSMYSTQPHTRPAPHFPCGILSSSFAERGKQSRAVWPAVAKTQYPPPLLIIPMQLQGLLNFLAKYFSPFDHSTGALSVLDEYQGRLARDPPRISDCNFKQPYSSRAGE